VLKFSTMTSGYTQQQRATQCLCHGNKTLLCSSCVQRALQDAHERRQAALQRHERVRQECTDYFQNNHLDLSQLQYESQRLREKLERLRHECSQQAVQVAAAAIENEERQQQQHSYTNHRQLLYRLQSSLQHGAMSTAIEQSQQQVRKLRFSWALQAIICHRLDVRDIVQELGKRMKHARGIGKIGGLPLPHAGPELYGVLPPEELQSALRLVASVTSLVARCLGIVLPHPILLQPNDKNGDIADPSLLFEKRQSCPPESSSDEGLSASTASLASLMNQTAKSALARVQGHLVEEPSPRVVPPSMDPTLVQLRVQHATAAVLAEDAKNNSLYVLSAEKSQQDEFAIALQLLQNNIIALCIRAGVPVSKLWPAEAVLLNLQALYVYCQEQINEST